MSQPRSKPSPSPAPPEPEVQAEASLAGTNEAPAPEALREIPVEALLEPGPLTVTVATLLTKDQFFEMFSGMFSTAGYLYGFVPPLNMPLQSLVRAPEAPTARPASDALYEIAEQSTWLHWLIEKDSKTLQQLIVIGSFGLQVATNTAAELRQHRALIQQRIQAAEAERAAAERREQEQRQPN